MTEPSRIDRDLAEVRARARDVYTDEGVEHWMGHPNHRLEGMTPTEAVQAGHTVVVLSLLQALADGTAT